jgi:multicomponent K+:H+ antiporter subunit E
MRLARGTRRWPPVLVVSLLVVWLLLNESLSIGNLVLGIVLALSVSAAISGLRPLQPKLRRGYLVAVLLAVALRDIVRSNFNVARVVLGSLFGRDVRPGFVKIPLTLKDPHGLAVLAGIVTSTPGTVWVDHDVATSTLTLHVLDLVDESTWIAWIKDPYERLLLEIFE